MTGQPWRAHAPHAELVALLRIAKLRHLPGEPGWGIRFASTPDLAVFDAGKALVKALPLTHRRWDAAARLWWVSNAAFPLLRDAVPALDTLLVEMGVLSSDAPEGYVFYQHFDADELPTYRVLHRLSCGSAHTMRSARTSAQDWSPVYDTLAEAARALPYGYAEPVSIYDVNLNWQYQRLCKHCLPGLARDDEEPHA